MRGSCSETTTKEEEPLERRKEVLTRVTAFWGIGFPLVCAIVGGSAAWASSQAKNAEQDVKLQTIAEKVRTLERGIGRTDRNIVRIGSKLGVEGLENPNE